MDYYERALRAIRDLFDDTSVPPEETRENLLSLVGEIDIFIEALDSDLGGT